MKSGAPVPILGVGLAPGRKALLGGAFDSDAASIRLVPARSPEVLAALAQEPRPQLVLYEDGEGALAPEELAAAVKASARDASLLALVPSRRKYDRQRLLSIGFTDGFLLPLEDAFLSRAIAAAAAKAQPGAVRSGRSIRLGDLVVGAVAPCRLSVFLSANGKVLPFIDQGTELTAGHLARLQAKGMNALHVATEDLPAFYAMATAKARARDKAAKMGLSERRHRFEDGVRTELGALFRGREVPQEQAGAHLLEKLEKLVRQCLLECSSIGLEEQLVSVMGQLPDGYSKALNTASYALFFSIALGLGNPTEVAIAGLLHDIGELDCAGPGHVEASVALLAEHHVSLSRGMSRAIAQHHERVDGKGYPQGLAAEGVAIEAQLLAAADRFDEATRAVPGQAAATPQELVRRFRQSLLERDPGAVDPALVEKICALIHK